MLKKILFLLLFSGKCIAAQFSYGVCAHPINFDGDSKIFIKQLKANGFDSVRFDYPWSSVEKNKGVYTPIMKLDEIIKKASIHNIGVVVILDYGNSLYKIGKPKNEVERQHFFNYVSWVANRYKSYNVIFEIWNEWSTFKEKDLNVSHDNESLKNYYALVKGSSDVIKKISPQAKVIAGGIVPKKEGEIEWAIELAKMGIFKYIDGLSIHPYNYSDEEIPLAQSEVSNLVVLHERISKSAPDRDNIKFYITEIGIPVTLKSKYTHTEVNEFIKTYYSLTSQLSFIEGVWWYDLIDDGPNPFEREDNFGFIFRSFKSKYDTFNQ
ncbi:cellulase family glycosylhydrolase [Pluralibacter gergoviae]|uniref:cellulase family glycosylhydrolase n=1 Tax=Pluralibacter gergoviae TaxID=61647 RepID=UPI00330E1FAF|nr:cellulase family glycosylhydrolase [Pluralibacter gergoviae]